MNTVRLLAAGGILSAAMLSAPVYAGGDSGFYIGAGIGQASVDNVDGLGSFDADDTAYKLIGGYNFGIVPLVDLSAEIEYVDFGSPADGSAEVDGNAIAAFGLAGVNLGPVGLFGKAGAFTWDADASDGTNSVSDDGTDMAYGIGARFHIGSFQIRAEYEIFDVDIADVDLLSASFIYTF
ncbi:MAG: outer membrane beta-barrel protein [Gammaproteobacteria bacterium]